jgi:Ca2+-binding EF-hand superfamily protein
MRTLPRPTVLLAAVALGLPGVRAAAPDPSVAEDVQDLIYFAPSRPFLFRLHLRSDGKAVPTLWAAYLRRLFAFLDRDDDGVLNNEEAARVLPANQLLQLFQGTYYLPPVGRVPLEELDADHDGKVSPDEFLAYYRRSGAGPVYLAQGFQQGPAADVLTEALFRTLDTNHDGRLSRAEAAAAADVLHAFDQDDDETITAPELFPGGVQPFAVRQAGVAQPLPQLPLMLAAKEEAPRRLTQRMRVAREVLGRYDKDRNQKLSRDEFGLPPEEFKALDANKDGELDVLELLRWVILRPDAEAVFHLVLPPGDTPAGAVLEAVGATGAALRRSGDNVLALAVEDGQINLVCTPTRRPTRPAVARQFFRQQLMMLDTEGRGFVTRKQLASPQGGTLRPLLDFADRDEDGRLTRQELDDLADLLAAAPAARASVTFTPGGRGLFQILDADHDGRLSVRELRAAWGRLAPYDRAGEGRVSRRDIPQQFYLVLSQGEPNYTYAQPAGAFPRPAVARAPRGPLWFRRMDRNGDGDVSPREFLGPPAAFRKLDADGDGLISVEEAEKADRDLRRPAAR